MVKVRAHILISGRVQGVFFRSTTRRVANTRQVTGWIRNRLDGRVEAVLEGDDTAVNQVIAFCRHGPPAARVTDVEVRWAEYHGEWDDFSIRWMG